MLKLKQLIEHFGNPDKKNQLLIGLSVLGILAFLVISSVFTFSNPFFRALYPKLPSHASTATQEFFPYGSFDDQGNVTASTALTNMFNELLSFNMDSVMFNNTSFTNPYFSQMLTIADQKNFNIIAGPQQELYRQWWEPLTFQNPEPSLTINSANAIAQPLVAQTQNHPSFLAYNLVDDSDAFSLQKRNLIQQAFSQLDPDRAVSLINGIDTARYDFTNNIQPRAVIYYNYPAGVSQAACVFNRGGLVDWVDSERMMKQYLPPNTPIWQILQTHQTQKDFYGTIVSSSSGALRYPTVEELRLQQWLSLGEGVTGIFWFTYLDLKNPAGQPGWLGWKNQPAFLAEITDLSTRLKPLRPLFLQIQKIDDKFSADGSGRTYVSTFKNKSSNTLYVLVVNNECSSQTVTVKTKYLTGQLKNLETNQIQNMNDPINLRGGDAAFFELVNPGLVSPMPALVTATNLVTNPGFETLDSSGKPTGWSAPASAVSTSTVHQGNNSLSEQGPISSKYYWTQPVLQPNTKYMLSAWIKTNNATTAQLRYVITQPSIASAVATAQLTGTKDWQQIFALFTTPPDYVTGRLDALFTMPDGGQGWIDEVRLCAVNESCSPLPYTPLTSFNSAPVSGIPAVDPNYSEDVTTWWNNHPLNPAAPSGIAIGGIKSPSPILDVQKDYAGDIQAAINALPTTGGTLFFQPGTYAAGFQLVGKSNVHFISDGGATIKGNFVVGNDVNTESNIAACTQAVYLGSFNACVFNKNDPNHLACVACATTDRIHNIYFKNITFDGAGISYQAFTLRAARDIVFDNDIFQNFVYQSTFVRPSPTPAVPNLVNSTVNGEANLNNIWFRGCQFLGSGAQAVYMDGLHGGGIINSIISGNYNAALWLETNNDWSIDYNDDGVVDSEENRISDYFVFDHNTISIPKIYYGVNTSARDSLFSNNTLTTFTLAFLNYGVRGNIGRPLAHYNAYNDIIENNTVAYANNFALIAHVDPCDTSAGHATDCGKIGLYTFTNNKVNSIGVGSTTFKGFIAFSGAGTIDQPTCVQGNSIAGTPIPDQCNNNPSSSPQAAFNLSSGVTSPIPANTNFSVQLKARSDTDSSNLFTAKITFPANLMAVQSISTVGSFVTNWADTSFDNTTGTISISGGLGQPGFKTSGADSLMATINFKTLAGNGGTGNIDFNTSQSSIYRNSDNLNILTTTNPLALTVNPGPTPTASPTGSPHPTPSPMPSPTASPTPAPIACSLTSANWSNLASNPVSYDTTVNLTVKSVGDCTGKTVSVVINQDNGILPAGSVSTNPNNGVFVGNTATTTWVAEYQPDGPFGLFDPPEFYFTATLTSLTTGTTSIKSVNPELQVNNSNNPNPSASPTVQVGDGNHDGKINLVDLSIMLSNFTKLSTQPDFPNDLDINDDGIINSIDFSSEINLLRANHTI